MRLKAPGAKIIAAAGILLLLAVAAFAQRRFREQRPTSGDDSQFHFPKEGEFHFLRGEYDDGGRRGCGGVSRRGDACGWAFQDWPDADNHFSYGIQRLTVINVGEPRHVSIGGPDIFDYPWYYTTQNNFMELSRKDTDVIREYLNRGGFMMTDDMYDREGDNFYGYVKEIYPDREIEEMSEADPMMHVHYDILDQDRTFIPGTRHIRGGEIRPDGIPQWKKVSDAKGHVVMAIDANTDIGDAWEYADDPQYPEHMTTLAYHYGINYIIYSMTH